jgi:site-specific recombinase XerD
MLPSAAFSNAFSWRGKPTERRTRHSKSTKGLRHCLYAARLRHTFALQYLKLGGDPYSLQYLLGHEDMATVREYVKIAAQDVKEMYKSPLDAL